MVNGKGNETHTDPIKFKPPVAGPGSKLGKKPDYYSASDYMPEEKVNEGPSGGKKGGVKEGHGQDLDNWAAEHNKIVGQSDYQKDPYRARGEDFPVKQVKAWTDQDGIGPAWYSEGHNWLTEQSMNVEGPRHCEDGGDRMPVPADRSRVVDGCFPISVSKGESEWDTGEIGIPVMVDFQSGHIRGGDQGPIQWVPQHDVHVGSPPSRNMKAGQMSGQEGSIGKPPKRNMKAGMMGQQKG